MQKGEVDLAVVSDAGSANSELASVPLLRDPYVFAMPEGLRVAPADLLADAEVLPFLRFNQGHLIGKHIEAHLARNNVELPNRFVFDSVQSIMAIIASGAGWSIITPLGFMRAQRFAANVRLYPVPMSAFSRDITLLSRGDFDSPTRQALAGLLRQIMNREVVGPACKAYPWLTSQLTLKE